MYSATGEFIIVTFVNNTTIFWDSETFTIAWKIGLDQSLGSFSPISQPISISAGDEYFAAVSSTSNISVFIWNIANKSLQHELTLEAFASGAGISIVKFVGKTCTLAVVCSDGRILFVDTIEGKLLAERIVTNEQVENIDFNYQGSIMAVLFSTFVQIYTLNLYPAIQDVIDDEIDVRAPTISTELSQPSKTNEPRKNVVFVSTKPAAAGSKIHIDEPRVLMSEEALVKYLGHFGQYPERYRLTIWKIFVQLPEN